MAAQRHGSVSNKRNSENEAWHRHGVSAIRHVSWQHHEKKAAKRNQAAKINVAKSA